MDKRRQTARTWHGVRMRRVAACADPEAAPRLVKLPAAWEPRAAVALAGLAPGVGPVTLDEAADTWIAPIAARAAGDAPDVPVAERLRALLLLRRGTAAAAHWRGGDPGVPGFVLNLAAFNDADFGFDADGLRAAAELAAMALTLSAPFAPRIEVAMADLAGLLASLGLDYGGDAARAVAGACACLVRAGADAGSAAMAERLGVLAADATQPHTTQPPPPPATCIPGLAAAAARAVAAVPRPRHHATTAVVAPDLACALLGVETGGIAPAFSPLDDAGQLTRTARAYLAARGIATDTALENVLAGCSPIQAGDAAAHRAMHLAVAPFMGSMRPVPALPAKPALKLVARESGGQRRELPARRKGYTQKASVGGHKLYLRTGEYDDGALGEIVVGLTKESPAFRGLMDCFTTAVSLGLQHGVPLDAFVEALTLTQFGAGGVVEGDAEVGRASSLVDYVFRHLAASYLRRTDIPEPDAEATDGAPPAQAGEPLLPMDFPREDAARARRRALRLVSR